MNDAEFDAFVERVTAELNVKQQTLMAEAALGSYSNFWLDLSVGTLEFKDSRDRVRLRATVSPIGSLSTDAGTWQWAWADKQLPEVMRRRSEPLKALEQQTGMSVFTMPLVRADELMAWEFTAMAVWLLDRLGCYRAPFGQLLEFVTIDSIHPTIRVV
jgi:hypothetical protein